ncbi:AAA family ATPase [Streptomyces sp. NPDC048290]|uniref:helix-turn-helix transcriptional regulator n=1 Tax=Streptomyces sp. NPDC048290 TaxID=3155811 RepID=UPI00343DEF01
MAGARGGRMPFTGRDTALGELAGALRRPGCRAVLITGPPGVGKSRLAEEFLARSRHADSRPGVRVRATGTGHAPPLSALSPLLPPDAMAPSGHPASGADPAAALLAARRRAADRRAASGVPALLVVDDIHLLDDTSCALLALLLADGSVFLTATLPDGAAWPGFLRALWREDALLPLSLPPFTADETATLLSAALAGPVTAPAARALWDAARGNALMLRELLRAARADGSLREVLGVWCLARPLPARLPGGWPDSRLDQLTEVQRSLLELLAVCGPIGLRDGLDLVGPAVLAELEGRGLVVSRVEGRRERLALAPASLAGAVRSVLPRLRARALLLDQVARVRAYGARRTEDTAALARWEVEATGTADPELLVRAAQQALHAGDVDTMCALARAALAHGSRPRAALMLGEALGQRGDFTEGIAVLEDGFAAAGPDEVSPVAVTLAVHHFYGPGDGERALAVLAQAAERGGPSAVLAAREATLLMADGRVDRAREVLAPWPVRAPAAPAASSDVVLRQAVLRLQLASGAAQDAVATGRAVREAHRTVTDRTEVFYPARSDYLLAQALLEAGHFEEAAQRAREGLDELLTSPVPAMVVWFEWVRGGAALERGHLADAARHFREARAQAHLYGHRYAEQRALAGLVLAQAYTGHVGPEAADLAAVATGGPGPARQADTLRAYAWTRWLGGRRDEAAGLLRETAERVRARGETSVALVLTHDLVRWGDPVAARELPGAAAAAQGPGAAARAAHARALARRDPVALTAAAERWEALGAPLYAAEALAQAAVAGRRPAGAAAESAARRAATRARLLADRCGAVTPALRALADPALPGPAALTAREQEIADGAARGRSSRQIAAECGLSVRTVDNTLGRAYRKLGVRNRAELTAVLLSPTQARGAPPVGHRDP